MVRVLEVMTKRDLKVGPIPPYFRNLAHNLSDDLPNREVLYEAYMKYADGVEREAEKSLVRFKKKSYSRKFK